MSGIRSVRVLCCACVLAAMALVGPRVFAKDDSKAEKAKAEPAKADSAQAAAGKAEKEGAAAEEAAMAAYEKMNAPGKEHERLKPLAGEFEADVKWWMAPGQPPQSTKGKEKGELILGGRFLQTHYQGEMMGKPFSGQMLIGFDNGKKKYVSSWVDSTNTAIMTAEGTADEAGKVITLLSEMREPDGRMQKFKQVTTIVDDKSHTYHMMVMLPDGGEFKVLEITYKRTK